MRNFYQKLSPDTEEQVYNFLPDPLTLNKIGNYFSTFSDSTRLKILSALSIIPMCVGDLSKLLDINQTTLSHQLKLMSERGVIFSQREGKLVTYHIATALVPATIECGVDYVCGAGN